MSVEADLHVNDSDRMPWSAAEHTHALAVPWSSFGCISLLISRPPISGRVIQP